MNRKLIIGVCIAAAAASLAQVPDKPAPSVSGTPAFPRHLLADAGSCPLPAWPREALLYDLQGSSTVAFAIGADGAVERVRLLRSSGWSVLDDAALRGIGACRFKAGLDAAERAGPYPMQFAWKLDGAAGVAPSLRAGSCRPSAHFARFVPDALASGMAASTAPGGASGVRVRFLVGEAGVPARAVAEAKGQPQALVTEALDLVRSCRFDYDDTPGERSASMTGRVVVH
ncbi:TonB family protein [Massilia violaceinigra]|uniref:TonB family protein n=1 Tax=Massilia violaceinigra TaxID=2045208 RepID=A0ABY4A1M6_9BURK|nr:energy transducer TonB [Massilia violaceinigra]UOD27969.1 TonB family protein [Massilia violaceinigra]